MMLAFRINCVPPKSTGNSSRKIIKIGERLMTVKGAKAKQAECDLLSLLAPYAPAAPFAGPIRVNIGISWPWRKSEPKRETSKPYKWHTSKPDLDNFAKTLFDCMTRLNFWGDDSQIACLAMWKTWSGSAGISVKIENMDGFL